jgi:uncharacterized repeat protein (TIGR03843 family)
VRPTDEGALDLLRHGRIEVEGRLVDASNATLYCSVSAGGQYAHCVYKPVAGERPLWDFPDGTLAGREVAAYLVTAAARSTLVPPTVLRDGPFGLGMVQLWVEADEERPLVEILSPDELPTGWRAVLHAHGRRGEPVVLAHADTPEMRVLAALDVVLNNADRKGGHVLVSPDGGLHGVDHGVCLHTEDKLRTVLWGFLAEPLSGAALEALCLLGERLEGSLAEELGGHLTGKEVRSVRDRVQRLLAKGVYPEPDDFARPIPWPPI